MEQQIHKTETGRRWLVKKFDTWSCGYIEIDNNMPKDYLNEFYEQFPFYMGATFMGVVFPNLVDDGRALLGSPDFLLGAEPDKSPIERTIISFRPEFRDVVRQAIKDGNCFWAVGFDDNHIDRIGYEEMVFTTERIANQIDQVVISGGTDAEGR